MRTSRARRNTCSSSASGSTVDSKSSGCSMNFRKCARRALYASRDSASFFGHSLRSRPSKSRKTCRSYEHSVHSRLRSAHGPSNISTSALRCTDLLPAPFEEPPEDRKVCHCRQRGPSISCCRNQYKHFVSIIRINTESPQWFSSHGAVLRGVEEER